MKKEIKKLSGYYVSDKGMVYDQYGRTLIKRINDCGYYFVIINDRYYTIDYLVANAFVPNPDNGILVRHINGDKKDCRAINLEWYFTGEFENDPRKDEDRRKNRNKKVYQYDEEGNIIYEYENIKECKDYNDFNSTIYQVCKGVIYKASDGGIYRYEDVPFKKKERKKRKSTPKIKDNTPKEEEKIDFEEQLKLLKKQDLKRPPFKNFRKKKVYKFSKDGKLLETYNDLYECIQKNDLIYRSLTSTIAKRKLYKGFYFSYSSSLEEDNAPDYKVLKIDVNTNEILKVYDKMNYVKKDGYCSTVISRAIKNNKNYYGFKWELRDMGGSTCKG